VQPPVELVLACVIFAQRGGIAYVLAGPARPATDGAPTAAANSLRTGNFCEKNREFLAQLLINQNAIADIIWAMFEGDQARTNRSDGGY
jgi:hypothetical protein